MVDQQCGQLGLDDKIGKDIGSDDDQKKHATRDDGGLDRGTDLREPPNFKKALIKGHKNVAVQRMKTLAVA